MSEFDSAMLADRRIRSGHSVRSLASHLGLSPATVRAVEGGASPERYPWGVLRRYSSALGIDVESMFVRTAPTRVDDVADDVSRVVALIVASGGVAFIDVFAEVLDWSPERVRVALDAAEKVLPAVGLRVAWFGDSSIEILADIDLVGPVPEVSRRSIETFGVNRDGARLIWQLAVKAKLSRSDNTVVTHHLVDAGLLEYGTGGNRDNAHGGIRTELRLTAQSRFDLCLDD